jgi:3-hydroxybutyryl-CoA dehydrogenase
MEIQHIGIIGAGQMGSGIAQVLSQKGIKVSLVDINQELAEKGKEKVAKSLARLVEKEKLTQTQREEILQRILPCQGIQELKDVDFAIEAATENEGLKLDIFRKLDEVLKKGVILATNTSSISITKLASSTTRPEKVIGMHFMNPVPIMKLVEIIRGLRTDEETFNTTKSLAESLDKITVCSKDRPGFIVNRLLIPMINEACFALMEGLAKPEDIDNAMKFGTNHPMGPLALADLIGLDTVLAISEVLYEGLGDPKYRPCPLLKQYVAANYLGRKTKQGFYKY